MPTTDFQSQLELARRGDPSAINHLFVEYYPRVRDVVHRNLESDLRRNRPWLGALFSTGDVVQDVFVHVLRDLSGFAGVSRGEFVNFLISVTKNRLIDAVRFHEALRRDRRRVSGTPGEDVPALGDGPVAQAVTADEVARYSNVLASFSERERILLRSRLEDNVPYEQLSEELGFPSAEAARKGYCSAKARLIARLEDQRGMS